MSDWKAKRFWTAAAVTKTETGFGIALDGRPVKTPAKRVLEVPSRPLAEAIAAEWDAQEGVIDPRGMPFTRTANAAIDKVMTQHAEVSDMLAAYGDSDLLCYRAHAPEELVARQAERWDPLLEWAARTLDAPLAPRTGVMHIPQDPASTARLTERVHALNAHELAAFHDLVSLTGSLILGFAAARDAFAVDHLWDLSRLDEDWQSEQWGADEDADALAEIKREAFYHAHRVFHLARAR